MTNTPRLGLAYLVAAQAQKEVTHNEALNNLDSLVHLSAVSRSLNTPPASPVDGDVYIVGASPTDAWSGHAGDVASYFSGWQFKAPRNGWIAYVVDEAKFVAYASAAWSPLAAPYLEATFSWTPGTIATGSGLTSSVVTVSGAALGDYVMVAAPYDLLGVMATAYVSAAGAVIVRLHNGTGSSQTLATGTWRVRVIKQ